MNRQFGFTTVELAVVVSVVLLVVVASAAYAIPMIARESMRSAIFDVQSHLQLTRIEAVSRNHECRFVVDTSSRLLRVLDGQGTATLADDTTLYETTLPASVGFARPDGGAAVTLPHLAGSLYQARFGGDGIVVGGIGEVVLFGGEGYGRVRVLGAGGLRVERWRDSAWQLGG